MTTQPLSEVKAHLSDYVRRASVEHEHITITVNGRSEAMLIGVEEWESIEETLFWLSQPGIHEDLAEARANPGSGISSEEMAAYIAERRRAEGE
ncbi:type II toxin-antitoxin system Phd/YefM family antitoxin [Catenulispora sp. NF23]|uniref:Antitoxin n=1 Tax=Catenulispora pinistramenti TaxID=2705254 RepID=A0ABS5KSR4_9ACTN|nr:type II toxin-antitoxin system Phd/YefM family antitoxin [Catenulispora pinistramenti]MBS2532427.1 type II toxin-antitoxin system Phd/YefM family antitoxin [Catenulispora pinistramenti]MBS2549086.1 type II toxin-antitoxin system Phd/YefM family antitoxin [Catenulispora pinistramenti]